MQNTPPTPLESLIKAKEIAKSYGIKYIYLGNIPNDSSTYCDKCGEKLIDRSGFSSEVLNIKDSKCTACNKEIKGVWR
jgi:pyruvate formate lyase activating enzyme